MLSIVLCFRLKLFPEMTISLYYTLLNVKNHRCDIYGMRETGWWHRPLILTLWGFRGRRISVSSVWSTEWFPSQSGLHSETCLKQNEHVCIFSLCIKLQTSFQSLFIQYRYKETGQFTLGWQLHGKMSVVGTVFHYLLGNEVYIFLIHAFHLKVICVTITMGFLPFQMILLQLSLLSHPWAWLLLLFKWLVFTIIFY